MDQPNPRKVIKELHLFCFVLFQWQCDWRQEENCSAIVLLLFAPLWWFVLILKPNRVADGADHVEDIRTHWVVETFHSQKEIKFV